MFQRGGKEKEILNAALENKLYRKLKAIPELTAVLPVIRHLVEPHPGTGPGSVTGKNSYLNTLRQHFI